MVGGFGRVIPKSNVGATVVLIGAFFVLLFGVLAFSVYQSRLEAAANAESRAAASAQVVATNTKWLFELAHQALQGLDDALGGQLESVRGSTLRSITETVENMPGSVKVYVVDAQGRTVFSTDPLVGQIDITDREYFSVPASGTLWYTSSLTVSRIDGEQIFVFSKRLERGGRFAGVAAIAFHVSLFSEIWASLDLDHLSTVSIIRDDGQLVARYPYADGPLDMSGYVLFTDYLKESPSGTYRAISPLDGVQRFVGYRKVPGTDLVALSSLSAAAAYRLFWRNTYWTLALFVPVVAALAMGSVLIIRLARDGYARQAELAHALELNRLLFRDTHHRVKNNLQSVQSLLRMQDIAPETKLDLQARIAAMTAVHEHMYRLDQYAEIDAHELVPSIVDPLRQTFGTDTTIETDVDRLSVDRDFATPLALLINEVVTNALKYAFPQGGGSIRISLKRVDAGFAELVIEDDGIGFDPETALSGMGNRLIKGMVTQMDGTYAYAAAAAGTRFTARLRLTAVAPVRLALVR